MVYDMLELWDKKSQLCDIMMQLQDKRSQLSDITF